MNSFFGNWIRKFRALNFTSAAVARKHKRNSARKSSSTSAPFSAAYESLEERRLLATFYLDPNGSYFITGTYGNDSMVATLSGANVRVTVNTSFQEQPLGAVREVVFLALGGDDQVANNTSIPSRSYGGNGNDTLIGGGGNDRLIGNDGNDTLQGRDGNDIIRGSLGSNSIDGGAGNDSLYGGYGGKNVISGGLGDDVVYAGDQGDVIRGDAGNDQLYGGLGDDLIYGGDGSDLLMGWHGNDSLYSDGPYNRLYGGTGNDGLFAGMGIGNQIFPGDGKDRILLAPGQPIPQVSAADALIRFANRSANWNYWEIEALDRGLRGLHHRTNGTRVLKDTTSNEPLTIYKYQSNDPVMAGNAGWNYHSVAVILNPDGSRTETYSREIRLADFDENNSHAYRSAGLTLIHEISHSWDSSYEIGRVVTVDWVWTRFLELSGWTNQNPNNTAFRKAPVNTQEVFEYQVIGNQISVPVREWWYLASSQFGRAYGANNAKEDWAVSWELAFVEEIYGSPASLGMTPVPSKVARVNELFAALA